MTRRIEPPERAPLRAWPAAAVFAVVVFGAPFLELREGRSPFRGAAESSASFADGSLFREFDAAAEPEALRLAIAPLWREILFATTGRTTSKVVVGRDGRLFPSNTAFDYPGLESTADLADCARVAAALEECLAAHGGVLVTAPVPNKTTMYAEELRTTTGRFGEAYGTLVGEWRRRGLRVVDLRPALDPKVRDAWFPNDTHWSYAGARAAAEAVAAEVRRALPNGPPGGAVATLFGEPPPYRRRGDLTIQLGFRKDSALDRRFHVEAKPVMGRLADGSPADVRESRPIVVAGTSFTAQFHFAGHVGAHLGAVVERRAAEATGPVRQIVDILEAASSGDRPWPEVVVWEFPEGSAVNVPDLFRLQLGARLSRLGFHPGFARANSRPLELRNVRVENATLNEDSKNGFDGSATTGDPRIEFEIDESPPLDGSRAVLCSVDAPVDGFVELFVLVDGVWNGSARAHTFAGVTHVALPLVGAPSVGPLRLRIDPTPSAGPFRMSAPILAERRP